MYSCQEEIEKAVMYSKDIEKIKALLTEGVDINKRRGFKGVTLLHSAPTVEITKELLLHGAKVCVKNKQHQTALHYATMYQKSICIIRELLANGADIMAMDKESRTPLHYAVRNNKDSALALELLSKGAETNVTDIQCRSPLHYAAMNDREWILIRELLRKGAKVHRKDIQGRTPLHYGAINSKEHLGIHEMLRYGADPNIKDNKGRSPLHYAIMNNRKCLLVEELLKNGANVNVCDDLGYTPLYLAAQSESRNLKVVKKLLEYGANISIGRDEFWPFYRYCTALDKALYKRDLDCAKLLSKITLLKNFDINCKKCIDLDPYIEYPDHNELSTYVHACFCELIKMAVDKIDCKFTLYEFVTKKNEFRKPLYICSDFIQQRISSNYPIYEDIIMPPLEHCLRRASLLQRMGRLKISSWFSSIDCHFISREVVLNFDCIYKISEYLSNKDLIHCLAASLEFSDVC